MTNNWTTNGVDQVRVIIIINVVLHLFGFKTLELCVSFQNENP